MTDIIPSSGNVFADLGLDPEAIALDISNRYVHGEANTVELIRAIADAIRAERDWSATEQKHTTRFEARLDEGAIQIRVQAGAYTGYYTLSDQFMAGVRATFTEELVEALKIALLDLKLLENDIRLEIEAGGGETAAAKYDGLESIRIAKTALAKAEGKL